MGKPWEQHKLRNLMEFQNGFNGDQTRYGKGIPLISVMEILDSKPITIDKIRNKADLSQEELKRYSVEYGDVLFQRSSENFNDAGRSNIFIDKEKKVSFGGFVIRGKRKVDYDPHFMRNLLNSVPVRKQIMSRAQGAQHINVSQDSLADTLIRIPNKAEQRIIGAFFEQFDSLITFHERQLNLLKEQKKGLLQKIFSKNESNIPEIRFPNFTGPWEQRKLNELFIERNQQTPMSDEYPLMAFVAHEGVVPKGDRYDRSALVTDVKNKLYKRTELGDFIYSSNNLETGSIGLNRYGKACISPVYSIFQTTELADFNFLGRRLTRKDFINTMIRWRQGVVYGQWKIHESDFLKITIFIPSLEEQIKIGQFLDNFDNLITLHQRQLDLLKEQKKGLLQKMFPKSGKDEPELRFLEFR